MQSQKKDIPPPRVKGQEGGRHGAGPTSAQTQVLWQVWEDVRHGAEHFHQRQVPLPVNRLGRFVHGLCLPFHLVRVLLADGTTRWRYLRVSLTQVAVILALGVLFTGSGKEVVEAVGPEDWSEQVEEAQAKAEEAQRKAEQLRKVAGDAARIAVKVDVDGEDEDEGRVEEKEALRGAEQLRNVAGDVAAAAVKEALREAEKARRQAVEEAASPRKRTVRRVVYWATLLSSLHIAQWIVIALSRDYHTALGREASLLTGLPPEDEAFQPRVRLNLRWLRNKLKRRWRALLVFAVATPLLWLFSKFMPWGSDSLLTALLSVWGAWWFVVYTAGKSSLAWNEPTPREPWFLRAWSWLGSRVVPLRAPMGVYGSVWTAITRPVFAPAASVERQPWSFGGLSVTRAFAALPLVKCFLRPVIPVAAAHLLVAGAGEGSASPRPSAPGAPPTPPPPPPASPPPTA